MVAAGTALGAGFLDVLRANPKTETVRLVTELTLALILFADDAPASKPGSPQNCSAPGSTVAVASNGHADGCTRGVQLSMAQSRGRRTTEKIAKPARIKPTAFTLVRRFLSFMR